MSQRWLRWAQELQALAQNGLAYSQNQFDIERFEQVRRIAAEMTAACSELDPQQVLGLFSNQSGYNTPKIDVRGAVFQDGKILLVQELQDQNRWTLPGGWADTGDTPSEAVIREIREESGFETQVKKLAAVYDRTRRGHPPSFFSAYKLFFICEITGGQAASSNETGKIDFFAQAELGLLDLSIGRVTLQELNMLFDHHSQPQLPTEFD